MFRPPASDVHVHVWAQADPEAGRCLAFRNRLRQHPEDRLAYERLKRDLALRHWDDMNEYADAKSELIATILARAEGPSNRNGTRRDSTPPRQRPAT